MKIANEDFLISKRLQGFSGKVIEIARVKKTFHSFKVFSISISNESLIHLREKERGGHKHYELISRCFEHDMVLSMKENLLEICTEISRTSKLMKVNWKIFVCQP
jgi:hypothetical protein